ncbi:MAG: 16S rRNA (guanine(527)-N(7))-methyltransferase RsmG [Bacilli bacterium]|nr:16S rRNA (guanine(527)-N(7))-methyltransferase RsmG [Bacilli bacterium]MDD3305300.1 16S rRNA (guanine(527)-N(7))-methyltransferase RsmG [Bacilli bacterium]MDD4053318.1 16S rRNA (guanine(527)-N(7))-methyltransferase RsmG [Bacilli bacterium]MDD4411341.1 16S rRNA (guanine(527)-N(7))-methyltransferase RsmG [Bacilli bacterium]
MTEKEFVKALNKLGIDIDEDKLGKLDKYYHILIEKNKIMNLTNIIRKEEVYLKHYYDSLTISLVINFNKQKSLCDIGTGAGFPGIVLKILFPHLKVVLIDSLAKRITFLNEVIEELDLKDIEVIHVRAEDYARKNNKKFDVVVSRAVAKLNILNELCLPLVKIGGCFISMKGYADEELKNIDKNLAELNSEILEIKRFLLPLEESQRTLIKIKKINSINKKYPREFKEIKRKPL